MTITKILCDRCRKEIIEPNYKMFDYRLKYARVFGFIGFKDSEMKSSLDLCDKCADEFVEWMLEDIMK